MNDPIDRQAAIDAVETKIKKWNAVDGEGYHVGLGLRYTDVIDTLTELPSAQPEPCGDVVSRNAIVQKLNEMDRYVSTELRLCDTDKKFPQNEVFIVDDVYEEIVEQLPSAQPDLSDFCDRLWKAAYERGKAEAQRTGKWIRNPDDTAGSGYFICSECKTDFYDVWKYCPNCGARMEVK